MINGILDITTYILLRFIVLIGIIDVLLAIVFSVYCIKDIIDEIKK